MAFQKPKKQPQFADLKGILAQSKTKLDPATYQTIETLIDRLGQFQSLVVAQLEDVIAKTGITPINEPDNGGGNGGTPDPHAPTHRPGGTDPLALNAWLDTLNEFTAVNIINAGGNKQFELQSNVYPALTMRNTSEVADARVGRLIYHQRNMRFDFTNDAESALIGHIMTFNRDTGLLTSSGPIQGQGMTVLGNANQDTVGIFKLTSGYGSPIAGKILFGDNTGWQLKMGPRVAGVDWSRFTFNDLGDFSMSRHLDVGGSITSVDGVTAGGKGSFSGDIISQGSFLHRDNVPAMSLTGSVINFFADSYDFINKTNTGYLARLTTGGNFVATGRIAGAGMTSSGSENYIIASQWVRLHFMDKSQLTGNQCFTVFNYGSVFRILPTTDDGGTPTYAGDWASSLNVYRDGHVQVGLAGFQAEKIVNGAGLTHGEWIPVDVGPNGGLVSNTYYTARYMRVGNTWTMSGQVDGNAIGGGAVSWFRCYLPSYYLHGNLLNKSGAGIIVNAFGDVGYCNAPLNAGHIDMQIKVTNPGNQTFIYHFTWGAGN